MRAEGAHQEGHAATLLLEGFLEGSLKASASWKGALKAPGRAFSTDKILRSVLEREGF